MKHLIGFVFTTAPIFQKIVPKSNTTFLLIEGAFSFLSLKVHPYWNYREISLIYLHILEFSYTNHCYVDELVINIRSQVHWCLWREPYAVPILCIDDDSCLMIRTNDGSRQSTVFKSLRYSCSSHEMLQGLLSDEMYLSQVSESKQIRLNHSPRWENNKMVDHVDHCSHVALFCCVFTVSEFTWHAHMWAILEPSHLNRS